MAEVVAPVDFLRSCWKEGKWADFTELLPKTDDRHVIDAREIRAILLQGLKESSGYLSPLRMRNVNIRGVLDLGNINLQIGNSLPALNFQNCDFIDPATNDYGRSVSISLCNVAIVEIALLNCRFTYLLAHNCSIAGTVNVSRCAPLNDWHSFLPEQAPTEPNEKTPGPQDPDWPFDKAALYTPAADWPAANEDQCSIDLRQSRIGGSFIANGTKLRSPPPRPKAEQGPFSFVDSRYALQLSETTISGGLLMSDGFEAQGGIKLDAAHVTGDVWLLGVKLAAGEGFALKAQAATFEGVFNLGEDEDTGLKPHVLGCINIQNSSALNFWLGNAWLQGDSRGAVIAWHLEVAADLSMPLLRTNGPVMLTSASIGKTASFSHSVLHPVEGGIALQMSNASIGGSLDFAGMSCRGQIFFENSEVGRNLDILGARFHSQSGWALWLKGVRIGCDLRISRAILAPGAEPTPVTVDGGIMLDRCAIGGDLMWAGLRFERQKGDFIAISLEGAEIRGSLRPLDLTAASPALIDLRSAQARTLADDPVQGWGDRAVRLILDGFTYSLASGPDSNLRHDASRRGSIASPIIAWAARALNARQEEATRRFTDSQPEAPPQPIMTFEQQVSRWNNLRVLRPQESTGRTLRLLLVIVGAPLLFLSNLVLIWQACLWRLRHRKPFTRLIASLLGLPFLLLFVLILTLFMIWQTVDLFLFQRVSDSASMRLHWLRKQYPVSFRIFRSINAHTYSPQPFEQMAKAMAVVGLDTDARRILLYKQRYRRRAGSIWRKPDRLLFDLLAGYGLSPWRATRTLLVFFLIGWFAVWRANVGGMLAVTVSPVATAATFTQGDLQPVLQRTGELQSVAAIRCGDTINEALYALDVFLPLVDLRQENECGVPSNPLPPLPGSTRLGPSGYPSLTVEIDHRLRPVRLPILGTVFAADEVDFWRIAKALYALAGWLLTSLAILTFSGMFRRN